MIIDNLLCLWYIYERRGDFSHMQNINSREELISKISNIFRADSKKLVDVFQAEFVENNKLTALESTSILSGNTKLDTMQTELLVWIYNILKKYNPDLKPADYYFTESEIKDAEGFSIKRSSPVKYPLHLKIQDRLDPYREVYQMSMSVKFLNSLKESGLIHLYKEIQRESTISVYNGVFVSHIAFNPERARQIAESMANRTFWSESPVVFILLQDGQEDYKIVNDELVIKSGNIALINGNHRVNAASIALALNDDIDLKLGVVFIIGTEADGKSVLKQS